VAYVVFVRVAQYAVGEARLWLVSVCILAYSARAKTLYPAFDNVPSSTSELIPTTSGVRLTSVPLLMVGSPRGTRTRTSRNPKPKLICERKASTLTESRNVPNRSWEGTGTVQKRADKDKIPCGLGKASVSSRTRRGEEITGSERIAKPGVTAELSGQSRCGRSTGWLETFPPFAFRFLLLSAPVGGLGQLGRGVDHGTGVSNGSTAPLFPCPTFTR